MEGKGGVRGCSRAGNFPKVHGGGGGGDRGRLAQLRKSGCPEWVGADC